MKLTSYEWSGVCFSIALLIGAIFLVITEGPRHLLLVAAALGPGVTCVLAARRRARAADPDSTA